MHFQGFVLVMSPPGRQFYKCGNNGGCNFFLWAEDGNQSNDNTRNAGIMPYSSILVHSQISNRSIKHGLDFAMRTIWSHCMSFIIVD